MRINILMTGWLGVVLCGSIVLLGSATADDRNRTTGDLGLHWNNRAIEAPTGHSCLAWASKFQTPTSQIGEKLKVKVGQEAFFKEYTFAEKLRWGMDFLFAPEAAKKRQLYNAYRISEFKPGEFKKFVDNGIRGQDFMFVTALGGEKDPLIGTGYAVKWNKKAKAVLDAYTDFASKDPSQAKSEFDGLFISAIWDVAGRAEIAEDHPHLVWYANRKIPSSMIKTRATVLQMVKEIVSSCNESSINTYIAVANQVSGSSVKPTTLVSSREITPTFD